MEWEREREREKGKDKQIDRRVEEEKGFHDSLVCRFARQFVTLTFSFLYMEDMTMTKKSKEKKIGRNNNEEQ